MSPLDVTIQISIVVFSGAAIWLLSTDCSWRRWGFVIGLLGQPIWFYDSLRREQYGVFALALWFTYCYIRGIYNFWGKKNGTNDK